MVFTGGPSGGKTSIIELIQRHFGKNVATVPEAATILYQGGFPRKPDSEAVRRVQRAIYYVTRELEDMTAELSGAAVSLCDRGTIDGMAYWPRDGQDFLSSLGTDLEKEFARYDVVVHLRPPVSRGGYQSSPTRIESHSRALELDRRIEQVWDGHPKRFIVSDEPDFLVKVSRVMEIVEFELPKLFVK